MKTDGPERSGEVRSARASASTDTRLRRVSMVCASASGLIALIGLCGWVFDAPTLSRLHNGFATMKVDTAVMLILIALGRLRGPRAAACCAGLASMIAVLTIAEYLLRRNLGIDQLLYADPGGGSYPGRPSLATAVCALLLAIVALPGVARRRRLAETLSLTVFAAAFLAVLGYLYGIRSLYAVGPYASVALLTALALLILSASALASVDRGVAMWVVAGAKPGATLMRVIAPVSFLVLPAAGYVCVRAERRGLVSGTALVALNVLVCLTSLIAAGWIAGVRVDRVDKRRRMTLQKLNELAADLERQVIERSSQVQRGRDELVLLADRQRIAADLHDIVIQRLFATGMMLNSVDPARVDPAISRRIDDAIEAMDGAIIDLRASIFELSSSTGRAPDLMASLDSLCIDAARVLRFPPNLIVDDPDDDAASIHAEILAVAREALANVARHAAATSVEVVLRSRDGVLVLDIVDDGVGMTRAPHSSGTQNMIDRAQRLGGDCQWTPAEPHGTRVRWQVPVGAGAVDALQLRSTELMA